MNQTPEFETFVQDLEAAYSPQDPEAIAAQRDRAMRRLVLHADLEAALDAWSTEARAIGPRECSVIRDRRGVGRGFTFRWLGAALEPGGPFLVADFSSDPRWPAARTPEAAKPFIQEQMVADGDDSPMAAKFPPVDPTSNDGPGADHDEFAAEPDA